IYRFRNSDPRLLGSDLENDRELASHVNLVFQSTNFRSAREIVEFNNALFPPLARALGHEAVYPPETDPVRSEAPDGYIDLEVLPGKDYTSEALDRMFGHICRELDPAQGGYRPADIAVLTRYNSEAAEVVEYLMERFASMPGLEHVKVISDESLMLNTSSAVRRVIAELSNRSVLPQPSSRQTDSRYQTVSQNQFDWIAAEFDRRRMQDCDDPFGALNDLLEEFNSDHSIATGNHVSDEPMALPLILAEAIGHLPEDLRRRDSIYLFALLDLVSDYCKIGSPSLHSFLEWWRMTGNSRCITSSPSADAITVMTVHKAKGLEYDCVHIPFTPKSFGKESDVRWYDCGTGSDNFFTRIGITGSVPRFYPLKSEKSMAEANTYFSAQYNRLLNESRLDDLNVLYVAFTRPVRELIVSLTETKKTESSDNNTTHLIASVLGQTDQAWHYTIGIPTKRIQAEQRHDSDAPSTVDMAEFIPPHHPMTAIIAEISDKNSI
ncbi:MAG: hypothetical protein K2M97_04875, partial [Muribaculaceae bacterium]|nr:hypothetical protein [Muribaculaceae bacterium]